MTSANSLTSGPIFTPALAKRMMIGAGIGLLVISFFVISAGKGNPAWSNYWRIRPLLLTPFVGAIVGLCYDVTQRLRNMDGWWGRLFIFLSLLGYCLGLFMGIVLGLDGTMWD
jgi:peptidoglycan/LPS O-acetylase OafA/YrhL